MFWILLACAAGMVFAQDFAPGQPLYHAGWYNACDVALFVLAALRLRAVRRTGAPVSIGVLVLLFGAAIVVFAGVSAGLMGPDTHTIVGAPGATVRDEDAGGSFVFPLSGSVQDPQIAFVRGNTSVNVGRGARYTGGFVLWQQLRTVVRVDAADPAGNHLTITQPTNASFLSPILLMQQQTTIDGMNVRFDSFSVPALRRNVKAVLFDEQQAAQLHADPPIVGEAAVLFAVSDNADRVVPSGINIAASGEQRLVGGLRLRGSVEHYPAVVVASAPFLPVLLAGALLLLGGAVLMVSSIRSGSTFQPL